jgi:hypothetical protein
MSRTPFGKTRRLDNPYAVYTNPQGWEWRILKTYQHPDKEKTNQYCTLVRSCPFTHDIRFVGVRGHLRHGDTTVR